MIISKKHIKKAINEAIEEIGDSIYYHGGDANDKINYNGGIWLADNISYAKEYAKVKENPMIWKFVIDESKLRPISYEELGDDVDLYHLGSDDIKYIKSKGYNCYCMYYDEFDTNGIFLMDKRPIISMQPLSLEEYNNVEEFN